MSSKSYKRHCDQIDQISLSIIHSVVFAWWATFHTVTVLTPYVPFWRHYLIISSLERWMATRCSAFAVIFIQFTPLNSLKSFIEGCSPALQWIWSISFADNKSKRLAWFFASPVIPPIITPYKKDTSPMAEIMWGVAFGGMVELVFLHFPLSLQHQLFLCRNTLVTQKFSDVMPSNFNGRPTQCFEDLSSVFHPR